jgi:diguanylate cyclase (GGDEF)-like protein/PAS domain S-box-containing protein
MTYVSENVKEVLGYEQAQMLADPHFYQTTIHPDDLERVRESWGMILGEERIAVVDFRLMTLDGEVRWVENHYGFIRDRAGRMAEVEGLLVDITERKAAEEKIAHLARTDPLTGLPNRATFIERLQQAFAAARRGARPFAVMYVDLDRFKEVNDTYGHPAGDRLLTTVAERLSAAVRGTDVVGRLGGDEFGVLQAEVGSTSDAGMLAEKIRKALAEPIAIEGHELHTAVSLGISVYAPDVADADEMLAQADAALYRAKEEGRNQYRFHTEELDARVREEFVVADDLSKAIERGELELHYQPQVEHATGRIAGMEALLRWNHPTRGLLRPAAFLAIAEKTGLIKPIGQWVLDKACEQMHRWRQQGIAPMTLAVNVSSAQIKAGDEFVLFVTATLAKWGLSPGDLELGVTESTLARATLSQNDVLQRFRDLGIKISIDDFGTKYSTLDYLRTYGISRIRIPQPLLVAAPHEPESAALVRAIVGIARELGIDVVAQGVETEDQWSLLSATPTVTKVQGYYFSEPVPANRAEQQLRQGRIGHPTARRAAAAAG